MLADFFQIRKATQGKITKQAHRNWHARWESARGILMCWTNMAVGWQRWRQWWQWQFRNLELPKIWLRNLIVMKSLWEHVKDFKACSTMIVLENKDLAPVRASCTALRRKKRKKTNNSFVHSWAERRWTAFLDCVSVWFYELFETLPTICLMC